MKKLILMAAVAVMAVTSANAQGEFWVGGTFGFESAKINKGELKSSAFSVMPEFGFSFSDKWALGIQFVVSDTEYTMGSESENVTAYGVAPFVRHTYLKWKALNLHVDCGFAYLSTRGVVTEDDIYPGYNTYVAQLMVNPGFSVNLSKRCALVGSMNIFRFGYTGEEDMAWRPSLAIDTWSCELNSPLGVDNIQLGFNLTF
jgi:hypothetical protein